MAADWCSPALGRMVWYLDAPWGWQVGVYRCPTLHPSACGGATVDGDTSGWERLGGMWLCKVLLCYCNGAYYMMGAYFTYAFVRLCVRYC